MKDYKSKDAVKVILFDSELKNNVVVEVTAEHIFEHNGFTIVVFEAPTEQYSETLVIDKIAAQATFRRYSFGYPGAGKYTAAEMLTGFKVSKNELDYTADSIEECERICRENLDSYDVVKSVNDITCWKQHETFAFPLNDVPIPEGVNLSQPAKTRIERNAELVAMSVQPLLPGRKPTKEAGEGGDPSTFPGHSRYYSLRRRNRA